MTILKSAHPEMAIDNFSHLDGTIIFFSFVKAALRRTEAKRVLDFGAGRGMFLEQNSAVGGSWLKRDLMDLRTTGAEVWAADLDPIVMTHPASDHQHVIVADAVLPFEDGFFDVIVSDVTFEHVEHPQPVARELFRVLRPGGYICARTPNKYGYVTAAARIVPNRKHVAALSRIAPSKEARDVFPTVFRMNTVRAIRRLFPQGEVLWYRNSSEPSYYFNNRLLFRVFSFLHSILPNSLSTSLCVFIRKPLRNSSGL